MMGGKCQKCACADILALRFHHTRPLRRGRNKRDRTSSAIHCSVIYGHGKGIRLLCANCSVVASARAVTR